MCSLGLMCHGAMRSPGWTPSDVMVFMFHRIYHTHAFYTRMCIKAGGIRSECCLVPVETHPTLDHTHQLGFNSNINNFELMRKCVDRSSVYKTWNRRYFETVAICLTWASIRCDICSSDGANSDSTWRTGKGGNLTIRLSLWNQDTVMRKREREGEWEGGREGEIGREGGREPAFRLQSLECCWFNFPTNTMLYICQHR